MSIVFILASMVAGIKFVFSSDIMYLLVSCVMLGNGLLFQLMFSLDMLLEVLEDSIKKRVTK